METLLTNDTPMTFVPKAALILFSNNQSSYLELRPILRDGSMGAARGVSRKFMKEMMEVISTETKKATKGFVPENMLYYDSRPENETFVWYNPPMKRMRYFTDNIGLEDGEYNVPGTIYIVAHEQIFVYCYKGKGRPNASTPLFKGPFFNVYENGKVCTGSANTKIPDYQHSMYESVMKFWEDVFWKTRDAHTIGNSPSTKHNLIETIKKYRNKPFSVSELNGYSYTLESMINKINNETR